MAEKKHLKIFGLDGTHLQTIAVSDDTKMKEISSRFYEEGKGSVTLLRGEKGLQAKITVTWFCFSVFNFGLS